MSLTPERDASGIPAGGYPALEGQSVRTAQQLTEAAGLPAISLAEAIAIRDVCGSYGYPSKRQRQVIGICEEIIFQHATEKMKACTAALTKAQGQEVAPDGQPSSVSGDEG